MKSKVFAVLVLFVTIKCIGQQTQVKELIQPYLQDANPNSIKVLWETSNGEESIVEWGENEKLKNRTEGKALAVNYSSSRIHEVLLSDLKSATVYYYRVKTGNYISKTYHFKTPPVKGSEETFNIVAMSDMQYDHTYPDKFAEVVNDGVIKYLEKELGDDLSHNLALVMIPGDLVENGSKYHQWKDYFFDPAQDLFSHVPVYPVLGNHEVNSQFYFKYFSLPENGNPAYSEHWWYKDYGNTRIIGLDSNGKFINKNLQKDWLKKLLKETEEDDSIAFVFAQLHHPHKSELWIPGESDVTGEVVEILEDFTNRTGKPSIHFFGHTHGYSRGQSKDHKHLWINVATAGGSIDKWGEFEGRDYEEFTVTQSEYGFVMVEVDANKDNPKFTVKRISRGSPEFPKNNELTDSVTVYKNERKPFTPKPISPISGSYDVDKIELKATEFRSSYSGVIHAASQWQISETEDFKKAAYDSWKQHENWYYEENRQKDDDLSDEKFARLKPSKTYYWRVRYRDENLNWSDWSEIASFKTNEVK